MKKDLIKLAIVGLTAGLCLSAKEAPTSKKEEPSSSKNDKELAMSKCSKDKSQQKKNPDGSCSSTCSGGCSGTGDDSGSGSPTGTGGTQGDQSKANKINGKRKSAAQKVVQGK